MIADKSSHTPVELSPRRKHAVLVSASLVCRDESLLLRDLREALDQAFEPPELVELILQSLLFDGYPCALEGLIALKNLSPEILPADESIEKYSSENLHLWIERGDALCQQIYENNFDHLLKNVAALSPTLKEWMLIEGYGRVLARPALQIDLREMGIIAILTVKALPRQLHSHMRGALRVGVSAPELKSAVDLCKGYTSPENIQYALEIWRKATTILS